MTTMREKEINETRRLLHLWSVGQVHSEKIVKRVAWHLDDADALESRLSEARAEVARLRAALAKIEACETGLHKSLQGRIAEAAIAADAGQMKETKCDKDFAGTLDIDGQVTVLRKRTP